MGGVDRNDQLKKYYTIRLKSRKVYKYVFWFMFEVVLVNTYILSRYVPSTGHGNRQYVDFRVALADQLIGDYNSRKRRGRPSLSTPIPSRPLLLTEHFPMQAEKRSRCYHCYHSNKKNKWTRWRCNACSKYLCHTGLQETDYFLKKKKSIRPFLRYWLYMYRSMFTSLSCTTFIH